MEGIGKGAEQRQKGKYYDNIKITLGISVIDFSSFTVRIIQCCDQSGKRVFKKYQKIQYVQYLF